MKKIAVGVSIFVLIFSFSALAMTKAKPKPYAKVLVYSMSVDALGKIGSPKARQCLLEALKSKEFFVRAYAAKALGRLGDKGSIPALKKLLKDRQYLVRITAVKALVNLGDSQAEKTLVSLLSDKNETIRAIAVSDLKELGTKFVPILLQLFKEEKNPLVRAKLLEQLTNEPILLICKKEEMGGIDPRLKVVRSALDDKSWEVRQAACYGIAVFNDKDSIPLLIKRLHDESLFVRAAAKESLGKLGEKSLSKSFWRDIESKNPLLKISSFLALANLKDTKIIPVLLKETVEPENSTHLRKEAVKALVILKPEVYRVLDNDFSRSRRYRYLSSDNLGINYRVKGKDLDLIFVSALKNPQDPLHNDAPFILKELNEELTLPFLRNALLDDDPDMIASAAYVLGELKDKGAVDNLIEICKKYQL